MKVLSSINLKEGAMVETNQFRPVVQPLQFLPKAEKTFDWAMQNADWLERIGIRQVKHTGRGLLKNIRLAKGIIEKSDYIPSDNNEYSDVVEQLMDAQEDLMDLQFFPLIPNVINILKAEFAKRTSKIMFIGKDDDTYNELLEEKRSAIEQVLLSTESEKMQQLLIQQGMDPNSPEFQQQMSPENIKTLPQIQQFFNKDYTSLIAEWAQHQFHADSRRFGLGEMEVNAFESSITTDREFWHFPMGENDYGMELWDPVYTWVLKSPNTEYVSNGFAAGTFKFAMPSDILDTYGYLMTDEQAKSLEILSGNRIYDNYTLQGVQNDGSMYDTSKSYDWNTKGPSLGMRQFQSFFGDMKDGGETLDHLFNIDNETFDKKNCLRESIIYWKTQRKLFHLTSIKPDGTLIQKIVDEDYKVTDNPIYNTVLFKEKSKDSLILGDHLQTIWNNQTWGAVKISKGTGVSYRNGSFNFEPIYLGIDNTQPGPLKYQFKGDDTIWGSKLPVEGRIFSGKNTRSICPVDLMKPSQIGYNMVNNQIADILIDEIGPVAMVDQNMFPKHSMGEDWGPANFPKVAAAMKQYKLLGLDSSTRNMEGVTNFNQSGMLNFAETDRLMSRINLSRHYKEQGMEVIGITPQRVGSIQASETAEGTQTAVQNSYAQTEMLFIQHSDWLMPRVHTMRTDLAQYYHSLKSSLRLQYTTELDEQVNFQMNTTGILNRDINVICTTDANAREVLKKLKAYFEATNTAGGNLHDYAEVLKADSLAEMSIATKAAEKKIAAQKQAEYDNAQKVEDTRIAGQKAEQDTQRAWESNENALNRDNKLQDSLIKSAGMPGTDGDKNGQDDYMQRLDYLQKTTHFNQKLDLDNRKEDNKQQNETEKNSLKRTEIASRDRIANVNLQIARENKTKDELIASKKIKASQK